MALTRPTGEQLRFVSAVTGEHVLDLYLEAAEKGGRTLPDLLDDVFAPDTGLIRTDIFEFRLADNVLQTRTGDHPTTESGWQDITTFFRDRGAFVPGTAYSNLDLVTLADSSVYLVKGLSGGATKTWTSEANFVADDTTRPLVDVTAVLQARDAAQAAQAAAETAQAGAQTARTGAEAARNAAETARTGAQTAQTAAETARTGAETAQTGAQAARTAAETAQTAAEAAQTGSQTAQTAAQAARDAAIAAQTAAETASDDAMAALVASEAARDAAQAARTGAEAARDAAIGARDTTTTTRDEFLALEPLFKGDAPDGAAYFASQDLNVWSKGGIYALPGGIGWANLPVAGSETGTVHVFENGNTVFQLLQSPVDASGRPQPSVFIRHFDGTAWTTWTAAGGGGSSVSVGDEPPANPAPNELWFSTADPAGLFVFYDDGDTQQWVEANGGTALAQVWAETTPPASPQQGQLWFDRTPGAQGLYIHDEGQWAEAAGLTPLPRRNLLINGNFDVWQRGASFTGSNDYTADRWQWAYRSGGDGSVTQIAHPLGQTDVPGDPAHYIRVTQTTLPTSSADMPYLRQKIEDVRTLSGQTATLTFYTYGDAEYPVVVDAIQRFDGGGAGDVWTSIGTVQSGNGGWKRHEMTFTLPSIAGHTLGSGHCLMISFWMPADVLFAIRFGAVQLERGPVATPFEQRHIGEEMALCQRYYASFGWVSSTNAPSYTNVFFPVPMRTTPTIATNSTAVTIQARTEKYMTQNGPATANAVIWATADAEL